jgi:hypothetical protein
LEKSSIKSSPGRLGNDKKRALDRLDLGGFGAAFFGPLVAV